MVGYMFRKIGPFYRLLFLITGLAALAPEFKTDLLGVAGFIALVFLQYNSGLQKRINSDA
jgi:hypothetical protein